MDNSPHANDERLQFKFKRPGDKREHRARECVRIGDVEIGGTMPEIESFQQSVQHCFEVAKATDFLEENIALEAFELLTTNQYDHFAAHALGVSL